MSVKFKVDKDKCIGCGVCISVCPKGFDWDEDGKSKVIDSGEIEKCGEETVCPYEAVEKVKGQKS